MRTPHNCTIGLFGIAKLDIQTLSLPSTTTAHGPGRPPPVNGEPWIRGAVRPQQRDAAAMVGSSLLCGHGRRHVVHGRHKTLELPVYVQVRQMELAQHPVAETGRHPDVALAVDVKSAWTRTNIEVLGLARIGGWKSRHVLSKGVGDPDAVLLIDPDMEGSQERLAGFLSGTFANDPALGQIALREVD